MPTPETGLTTEQAIALGRTEFWRDMPARDVALFQAFEDKLCMPFGVFHEAMESALGRPVYTHEFGRMELLRAELLGDRPAPTFAEVLALIPAEKRAVVVLA